MLWQAIALIALLLLQTLLQVEERIVRQPLSKILIHCEPVFASNFPVT